MSAFLFAFALFFYWAIVGLAIISTFRPRLRIIQGILISPVVGIATVILPVFLLNRTGLPVKIFAGWLLPALGGLSLVLLFIQKPILPWKRLRWFGIILVGALLLSGWPLLRYGFNWLSFANDDMANYCLAAQRFLEFGFFDKPNLENLFAGKDYSQAYWFMHVAGGVRAGSELMLAAIWGATGLNAHQIFMPVILALHLSLITAGSALAAGSGAKIRGAILAMILITISPMSTLGVLYQLIGQVGGLAFLCAAVVLLSRTIPTHTYKTWFSASVPGALVLSGLLVWYPEVLPFLGLGWAIYVAKKFHLGGANQAFQVVKSAIPVSLGAALTLGGYLFSSIFFLLAQVTGGTLPSDISTLLFPYFLLPSGIPAALGLIPIATALSEPLTSIYILFGILLLGWFLKRWSKQFWQYGTAASTIVAVMLIVAAGLFVRNNDFGLFKLVMFIQPLLLAVLALEFRGALWPYIRRWRSCILILTMSGFLTLQLTTQAYYVNKSTGESFGSLNEIPHGSADKVNQQFKSLLEGSKGNGVNSFLATTSLIVLAKFQALYTHGKEIIFPSRPFFAEFIEGEVARILPRRQADMPEIKEYFSTKARHVEQINLGGANEQNRLFIPTNLSQEITNRPLILSNKSEIFNRYSVPIESEPYFSIDLNPKNRLMFVHSELGNHYYLPSSRRRISYYANEPDPLFPNQEFASLGRHLVFLVLGPTRKPRAVLELTNTVAKQFESKLPQPFVQEQQIGFVGRGTGRVFSAPLDLTMVNNLAFVSIDMGRDGRPFPNPKQGLMLLYGRGILADIRSITAFARDISLVSEEEYQNIQAPSSVRNFPSDLANKALEYSGIYEDGWISERAFFTLKPNSDSRFFAIKGMIPQVTSPDFKSTLVISIDGTEVMRKSLGLGAVDIKLPIQLDTKRHRIDLAFDQYQVLPGADARPVGGKIEFIGFTKE